jgi:carbonic anhydrase
LPEISTAIDVQTSYVRNSGKGFQLFENSPSEHQYDTATATLTQSDTSQGSKGTSLIGGQNFNFYQIHFHTPSENTIDGVNMAMEAQFVHQLPDENLVAPQATYHRMAVIALMYKLGTASECNTFLSYFWTLFPNTVGYVAYPDDGKKLDFNQMLSMELSQGYYHWMGSLTTPPCTEGVSWNLIASPEMMCQAQVDKLTTALAATQALSFNNRVTQSLNHRVVTEMAPVTDISSLLTQQQWSNGIETAMGQGFLTQIMAKNFLLVAKDMEAADNKADMIDKINIFDATLKDIVDGSADGTLSRVPNQRIMTQFSDVQRLWKDLKSLLEDNIDLVRSSTGDIDGDILMNLYRYNLPTLRSYDVAAERYKNAAKVAGAAVSILRVDIASRQRMLTQKWISWLSQR